MKSGKTIYALSSGLLPSGVAVVRISGPDAETIASTMSGKALKPRFAHYSQIINPADSSLLDHGIVILLKGPASATGEDCAEFHLHGGRAVVTGVLDALSLFPNTAMAEPGEFTRRAFQNGKLDLTEVEAVSDLISADTQRQREIAIAQYGGVFKQLAEQWRSRIISLRALVEADFDFADEEDVPEGVSEEVWQQAAALADEIKSVLDDNRCGEIIRDGFRVALMGPPNAGKSSLMNALAKRDVAIVSDEAGTTRDILEVTLDIEGIPVIIGDTAGQREADGKVEQEGIRRALDYGKKADIVIWLDEDPSGIIPENIHADMKFITKSDLRKPDPTSGLAGISVFSKNGLKPILDGITDRLRDIQDNNSGPRIITRKRHRDILVQAVGSLTLAATSSHDSEIRAEYLRSASQHIGMITGVVDVEELLGSIFSEFCVGK